MNTEMLEPPSHKFDINYDFASPNAILGGVVSPPAAPVVRLGTEMVGSQSVTPDLTQNQILQFGAGGAFPMSMPPGLGMGNHPGLIMVPQLPQYSQAMYLPPGYTMQSPPMLDPAAYMQMGSGMVESRDSQQQSELATSSSGIPDPKHFSMPVASTDPSLAPTLTGAVAQPDSVAAGMAANLLGIPRPFDSAEAAMYSQYLSDFIRQSGMSPPAEASAASTAVTDLSAMATGGAPSGAQLADMAAPPLNVGMTQPQSWMPVMPMAQAQMQPQGYTQQLALAQLAQAQQLAVAQQQQLQMMAALGSAEQLQTVAEPAGSVSSTPQASTPPTPSSPTPQASPTPAESTTPTPNGSAVDWNAIIQQQMEDQLRMTQYQEVLQRAKAQSQNQENKKPAHKPAARKPRKRAAPRKTAKKRQPRKKQKIQRIVNRPTDLQRLMSGVKVPQEKRVPSPSPVATATVSAPLVPENTTGELKSDGGVFKPLGWNQGPLGWYPEDDGVFRRITSAIAV
eukprot:623258_1